MDGNTPSESPVVPEFQSPSELGTDFQDAVKLSRQLPGNWAAKIEPLSLMRGAFDVFQLREQLIKDYSQYLKSFLSIRDSRLRQMVEDILAGGALWPDPLIQMNPAFESGGYIPDLVSQGLLHSKCAEIFAHKSEDAVESPRKMRLHRHQVEAIRAAQAGQPYVVTTGTGSGKSLTYIVPVVDHVLKTGSGKGLKAIIIYPMNALANSQMLELERFLKRGFSQSPVTFASYTGQEGTEARESLRKSPPDILLTNYVMMEYILTRPHDGPLISQSEHLKFLILDELHTYRGRQGADVALLVRRLKERCLSENLLCVGTSATLSSSDDCWRSDEMIHLEIVRYDPPTEDGALWDRSI